jgi:hypothetical protein
MITVEVFFSDERIYRQVVSELWHKGVRFSAERSIDDGAYTYVITEYTDEVAIIAAMEEFFHVNFE